MRSTGRLFRPAVFLIASGFGASQTQNVFSRSSLTYEWTQVTPSSALRSTTARQSAAPSPSGGIRNPSGNVRSTTYRGILLLPLVRDPCSHDRRLERTEPHPPHYPRWRVALRILVEQPEPSS